MENKKRQDNLFKALGLFIEAMRPYIISKLIEKNGPPWHKIYYETLTPQQKENWDLNIKNNSKPESLIDFHNLKGFAIRCKDTLKDDFPKDINKLPTWFEEIAETRNKCLHYIELDEIETQRSYSDMIQIARILHMPELEEDISALQDHRPPKTKSITPHEKGIIPWFKNVTPHSDIRTGLLDESIFAANLSEVVRGSGREIYLNSSFFFSKTFFTAGLKTTAKRVIHGLNGKQDAENRVITLQTGFGGGKTHALISLFHLVKMGKNAANFDYTHEILQYTGSPGFETANIAVFTNTTNDPTQGRTTDGLHIRTAWGEIAFQLGGPTAYETLRPNDENRTAPKGLFKKILQQTKPCLILIDELADYCVAASGIKVGESTLCDQTISFIQELSEAVSSSNQCVLVATLPASNTEVANSPNTAQILTSLSNRLSRVGADTKPIADHEIYEIIRRRLFENIGDTNRIEQVISTYMKLYQDLAGEVPISATHPEYREKLRDAYPFHPELIDMFRIRWASHHDFQRTRGVLRLLASITADLWKRQGSLTGTNALIHTSDIEFKNLDALTGQLKKLYGNGYDAVISADISGTSSNAFKIDNEKKEYGIYSLTQGTAATILLASFGSSGINQGTNIDEIKLCIMKPESFNHNNINGALDSLETSAHYLYYSSTGSKSKRYWFHTKPNMNILVNQTKNEINSTEINSEILKRLSSSTQKSKFFNILIDPSNDIPEQKKPTLIILNPLYAAPSDGLTEEIKHLIENLATKRGNNPRIFRNTFLFLLCTETGLSTLHSLLREFLASNKIIDDYQYQLEPDQKETLERKISETSSQIDKALIAAYCTTAKFSAQNGIETLKLDPIKENLSSQIDEYLSKQIKDSEWLIDKIGLNTLRTNNLLPTPGNPVKVSDIYDAFLRYDDKPMITGPDAVKNSIDEFCQKGVFAVTFGPIPGFTDLFYKRQIPSLDVTGEDYWLADKSIGFPPPVITTADAAPPGNGIENGPFIPQPGPEDTNKTEEPVNTYKSITVSGKADLSWYTQIFQGLILPLKDNNVEIEIKIKGSSTPSSPITETGELYTTIREMAYQWGLKFEKDAS